MTIAASRRPRVTRPYASGGSDGGKPCPTCYAPMLKTGSAWTCTKHGAPSRP